MREIKFRAKNVMNGEWVCGDLVRYNHSHTHISIAEKECKEQYFVHPQTIGQFTGLQDSKGNDIYEGDIVKYVYSIPRLGKPSEERTDIGYVGFLQQEAGFVIVFKKRDQRLGRRSACEFCVEVIGNIHDNPELMEAKQ